MISVIVPVFNAEKYLAYCIKSILNQTYIDFELLLINDGSSDESARICDNYAKNDSRIRVVHNKNHGVSYSRNLGLELAKGDYIAFCDADDQYKQNYLMEMQEVALSHEADIVICNYSFLRGASEAVICNRQSGKIEKDEVYRRIFIDNTIGGFVWNKLFKKSLLNGIQFDEGMQICEDTYFLCNSLKNASRVYYIGESLYLYRLHQTNTMHDVQNMIDKDGNLKYALVYEKILNEGVVAKEYAKYVKADECVLAIGVKCDYLNSEVNKDRKIIKNLNKIIKCNFGPMITCEFYSPKKKLIYLSNALMNIRKYKYFFNRRKETI